MSLSVASFGLGFATGFGTGLMTREISRVGSSMFKPLVKSVVKAGMLAVEQVRMGVAFAQEAMEDIVAEARDEASRPVKPAGARKPAKKVVRVNRKESAAGAVH